MKQRTFKTLATGILTLALMVGLAACDSVTAPGADEEADQATSQTSTLSALETSLTQELGLSSSQQQDLRGVMNRHEHRQQEPGFLWAVAADLQASLSDEQKQQLFDLVAQRQARDVCAAGGGFGPGFGPGGFGPGFGPGGPGAGLGNGPNGCLADILTDEQKDAIAEIHETYRPQLQALMEQYRNGELAQDAFREQAQALHASLKAEIDALLTAEQQDALEACRTEHRAEREAARETRRLAERAAMSEALGLTAEQEVALFALLEEHRAAMDTLIEQFRDELISCEDFQAALTMLHESHTAAVQDLLDETQWEIVQIHHALAHHMGGRGREQGPGGRGPGGPGSGGPGGQGGPGGSGGFGVPGGSGR